MFPAFRFSSKKLPQPLLFNPFRYIAHWNITDEFSRNGFCLLSMNDICNITNKKDILQLIPSVDNIWNNDQFAFIRRKSLEFDTMDEEDDPTSLGLLFYSTPKVQPLSTFEKQSFFSGPQLSNYINSQPLPNFVNKEVIDLMLPISSHLNEIGEYLLENFNLPQQNLVDKILYHETLINFYTNQKTHMYPHVDTCCLSIVFVPSLWYDKSLHNPNGLQLCIFDKDNNEKWIDLDKMMYNSLTATNFSLTSSSLFAILPGKYLIGKPTLHQVAAKGRQSNRISFAHFVYREIAVHNY